MQNTLEQFKQEILSLQRGGSSRYPRPHKLVMLLTVFELADRGFLSENKIYYNTKLINLFNARFEQFASRDDLAQAAPPFFHLRSSDFWFHKIKPGRESYYERLTTSGGGSKRILDNIQFAYLRDDVFLLVSDRHVRGLLREKIEHDLMKQSLNSTLG